MLNYESSLRFEAGLAASNLGNGLTSLRRYDFASRGRFFAGLFGLTIGLERILKLIVVIDHVLETGGPPSNEQMKHEIGHRIDKLFAKARAIHAARGFTIDDAHVRDVLVDTILDVLTHFARHSRYYNLDVVTGAASGAAREPLADWTQRVAEPIVARHHRWTRTKRGVVSLGSDMDEKGSALVSHTSDDGSPIRSSRHLALEAALIETKQKYSVLYLYRTIAYLAELLECLCYQCRPVLFIYELFQLFYRQDEAAVVRRKVWDPYR